jgi:alpha-tubulin suppressor-like RCC1 family protein
VNVERCFSWGADGVNSLHDDAEPKSLHDAQIALSNKLARTQPRLMSIALSSQHALMATSDGTVLGCGNNAFGQVDPLLPTVGLRPTK